MATPADPTPEPEHPDRHELPGGGWADALRDSDGEIFEIVEYAASGEVVRRTYAARDDRS